MKTIQLLTLMVLATAFTLTSCTMEKKVYSSGYHIEWKKNNLNAEKPESADNDIVNDIEKSEPNTDEQPQKEEVRMNNKVFVTKAEAAVSADSRVIVQHGRCEINSHPGNNSKSIRQIKAAETIMKYTLKKKTTSVSLYPDSPETNEMAIVGLLSIIVFIPLIIISSSLWALLLLVMGIAFSIIALHQIKKNPEKWKGKGPAIAALIISGIIILVFGIGILDVIYGGGGIDLGAISIPISM